MVHALETGGSSLRDLQARLFALEEAYRREKDASRVREILGEMQTVQDAISKKRAADIFAADAGNSGKVIPLTPRKQI